MGIYLSLLRDQTTTKQEQDLEDTKRINIGITTWTKEETKQKIEEDIDTTSRD